MTDSTTIELPDIETKEYIKRKLSNFELLKKWFKDCRTSELTIKQRQILGKWIFRTFYLFVLLSGAITSLLYEDAFIGVFVSTIIVFCFILFIESIQWMRELIFHYPVPPLLWIPRKHGYVWILP